MNPLNDQDVEASAANYDRCIGFEHVIKKGDTLYKISKQYNVKVSALILANPYVNIYNLQVGDTICIPRIRPIVVPVVPGRPMPEDRPPMRPEERPQERPPMIPDSPERPPMIPDRPSRPPMMPDRPSRPPMSPGLPANPEEGILPTPEVPYDMEMQEDSRLYMTVKELMDEWDISYNTLEDVVEIIKKLRKIL